MKMSDGPGNKPLGVFGGTFDPVHFGHLRLAEEAADGLDLASVRWIPAGQPVLRDSPRVSAAQRLEMVRRAIAGNPRFELDAAEVDAGQPSYTVPTLERLRRPDVCGMRRSLVLLVGADVFAGLTGWHRWQSLFELAHIGVAHRPGFPVDPASLPSALAAIYCERFCENRSVLHESPAGRIVNFSMTQLDISATRIRALLSKGQSARYLIPDTLLDYIPSHYLYLEK